MTHSALLYTNFTSPFRRLHPSCFLANTVRLPHPKVAHTAALYTHITSPIRRWLILPCCTPTLPLHSGGHTSFLLSCTPTSPPPSGRNTSFLSRVHPRHPPHPEATSFLLTCLAHTIHLPHSEVTQSALLFTQFTFLSGDYASCPAVNPFHLARCNLASLQRAQMSSCCVTSHLAKFASTAAACLLSVPGFCPELLDRLLARTGMQT